MSGHHDFILPREALYGASALISLALLGAIAVRVGLLDTVANPQAMRAEAAVPRIAQRDLRFLDGADGSVIVQDMAGATVATIAPGSEQGFVRGVMRGLARERRLRDVPQNMPFRLALWGDNGLTLTDLGTGRQIELGGFGATNRAAFATMLPAEGGRP